MAKGNYLDTSTITGYKNAVPTTTDSKVVVSAAEKRDRAELLDALEELYQTSVNSGISPADVRAWLHILVKSTDNSIDDDLIAEINTNAAAIAVINGSGTGSITKAIDDLKASVPSAYDTLYKISQILISQNSSIAGKVDASQVQTNVPSGAVFTDTQRTNEEIQDVIGSTVQGTGATTVTYDDAGNTLTINSTNTTYSVGDGGLTQNNLTNTLKSNYDAAYAHSQAAHAPSNATVNETDAHLKNRANHSGSQAISTVTNLQSTLDAKATQTELDSTQTGAGLNTDGTYTANSSSNYVTGATSLKDADDKLDAQIKTNADAIAASSSSAVATELNTTQTGAGLNADGTFSADSSTNYLTAATSLKDATKKLDTQIKTNADNISSAASTNLSHTANATSLTIESNTGNNTSLPAATSTAWGVMTDEDKSKLDGIAANATNTVDLTVSGAGTVHANNYTNTTYDVMSTGNSYAAGLVPAGSNTHSDEYLRKDGTWAAPPSQSSSTQSAWLEVANASTVNSNSYTVTPSAADTWVDMSSVVSNTTVSVTAGDRVIVHGTVTAKLYSYGDIGDLFKFSARMGSSSGTDLSSVISQIGGGDNHVEGGVGHYYEIITAPSTGTMHIVFTSSPVTMGSRTYNHAETGNSSVFVRVLRQISVKV